jgi:hypothetical protein
MNKRLGDAYKHKPDMLNTLEIEAELTDIQQEYQIQLNLDWDCSAMSQQGNKERGRGILA